ncbi:MAG TPA: PD-(D/E)XK nuclease family protein, partial [Longimicrobiales bacterium]
RLDALSASVQAGSAESGVLALARLAQRRLEERLEQLGAVDFDRMIAWTRDLLDEPSVCDALRRRIRVLIIDEFQDTDPQQKEIAYRLGDPASGRADSTRLVLVGDPKQSIYRFRSADVTVWNAVARDFEEGGQGRVLPLSQNRRSLPAILAFVDATVGRELARPVAGEALQAFEVPPQPLTAVREASDAPAVELLVTPATADGKPQKAETGRRVEAEGVAWRMRRLHDEEGYDWQDMALLLGSWSDMPLYESAMRRRGIPCYPLLSDGFYGRSEITDIIVALEAVRDPTDDRALFGFLRGPFVGVSDETLLRMAIQIRTPYWRRIGEVETPEAEVLRRGAALLDRYARLRDRVPEASLDEGLLHESGYLAHLALLGDDGQQAIANVRRFLDLARAAQEATLGEVLRRIGEERARGDRVAQARLHGEKDDVVLITSVHSAKGLEWRAVFWGDLGRQPVGDYDCGLRIGRETIVVGDPDRRYDDQDEDWTALYDREQEERRAEAKRTWYVATTRAKDLLVLSGLPLGERPRIKGSPAEMLLEALPALGNAVQLTYAGDDGRSHVARVRRLDDAVAQAEAALHAPQVVGPVGDPATLPPPVSPVLAPLGRGRHSATELMVFQRCPRRHWLRYIAGIREPAVALGGPSWKSAAVKGTVVHDVLEHLREEEDADALLEDAIQRHAPDAPEEDAPEGSRYRVALRREIAHVAEHPGYRALADHPEARRELPFLFILGEGRYAEGFFDLAAPGAEGLRILDVKTGDTPVAEAVQKYAPQRDVYTSAAAGIAGLPVSDFLFAFSHSGQVVPSELPAGDIEAARARVLEAVEKIEDGERALRPDVAACEWCAYRKVGVCRRAEER